MQVFLKPHLQAMRHRFDLTVLANAEENEILKCVGFDVAVKSIGIVRNISVIKDLKAVWRMYRLLKADCPNAVHTLTPKAGLIGMLAAWASGVPVRVHTFTGQVWITQTGFFRKLLKNLDKLTALLATDVLVDSPSQREFLIREKIIKESNSSVLAHGSISGVNTNRFSPNLQVRRDVRTEFGTNENSFVCLYVGRLNRDKGVLDLVVAFSKVAVSNKRAELWMVGPDEGRISAQMRALLGDLKSRVRFIGYTNVPEKYMQAADLFCLPSYREGFGTSVIEAAACGLPALASRIYGLTDAVIEGRTGWMHNAGDVQDLTKQLNFILSNARDVEHAGEQARAYASNFFSEDRVVNAMLDFYKSRLRVLV